MIVKNQIYHILIHHLIKRRVRLI